ncbi:hypothetical protein C2G38_2207686 [Gigaspora rosea]|uniref:Uncharacterized protein n=1 Tax=Gigaspora rosea TaxID=44941 RepID=A0A397UI11_9GLOM|nr:hypothetical protein C2G38_2207686 [Gigaspora rosea]
MVLGKIVEKVCQGSGGVGVVILGRDGIEEGKGVRKGGTGEEWSLKKLMSGRGGVGKELPLGEGLLSSCCVEGEVVREFGGDCIRRIIVEKNDAKLLNFQFSQVSEF